MVQHRQLNLMQDFSHLGSFDVIFCRNVLIYFDQDTKIGVFKPHPERRGLYRLNAARGVRPASAALKVVAAAAG